MPNTPNLDLRPLLGTDLARQLPALLDPELTKIDTAWGRAVQVVLHGATGSVARPSGPLVIWVGSATPTNASSTDLFIDTSGGSTGDAMSIPITTVTASTFTPTSTTNGFLIRGNSSGTQTVTLPNNFSEGFNFNWRQEGAGQASFIAASGATLEEYSSNFKTAGQKAIVNLFVDSNTTGTNAKWVLDGRTGA